jgi:hypothetical protein
MSQSQLGTLGLLQHVVDQELNKRDIIQISFIVLFLYLHSSIPLIFLNIFLNLFPPR